MTLNELRAMPESKRLFRFLLAALLIWVILLFLLMEIADSSRKIGMDIFTSDQIINNALVYRAHPASKNKAIVASSEEPLTVLSQIVDTLGLRERMLQLQSNPTGILLQMEKLYGDELEEFMTTIESRGLKIKTAEIKGLPSGNERLLGMTLLLEQNR